MQESSPTNSRSCRVCDAPLQPDYRYCPSCGTVAPTTPPETDPSTTETRQFRVSGDPAPESVQIQPGDRTIISPLDSPRFEKPRATWGTTETTVPPESSNRTLWTIIGIVAFIVLVCCCLLPLALVMISNFDTTLQDEIRSVSSAIVGSGSPNG